MSAQTWTQGLLPRKRLLLPGTLAMQLCATQRRAKISSSIKRDGLMLTQLPTRGKPAAAVLDLLKAKEARNIRISPGTGVLRTSQPAACRAAARA
jgi:hypothetical protein